MRWPFRRRAAESAVNAGPGAAALGGPGAAEASGSGATVERPQAREWSALPPLPGTFGAKAPLVIGPAPVLPPLPGRREPMPASEPLLRGSVQGIASVIKPVRFDREAADVVHRPVRRRAVVVPLAEPTPLTYVDDQHVEEPREPKVPHRAPAWLRYTPPAWMMQQNDEPGGLPDLGLPLPVMETPPPPPPPPAPVVRPKAERRANLGQSRRLGLGAPISPATQQVSEEPAPEEPAPAAAPLIHEPAAVQEPAPIKEPAPPVDRPAPEISESVPAELATAMRQTHRVEVADVPVVRGPAVSAEARSHGARAFTRAGKVHLPDEAGPLTSPKARGLIAHELVHAVQQRTLGLSLPSPSSDHGQALEAEAVAAERFYAGEAPEPQPLIHAPRLTPSFAVDTHTQLAPTIAPATTSTTPPQQVIDTRVREEVDRVATDTARRVVQQEWQNPSLTPQQRQALGLPAQGQQQQSQSQQQQQEDQPDPTAGYLEAAVLSRLRPSAARHAPPATTPQTTQSSHGPLPQSTAATVQPQSHQAVQQQQQQDQDEPADATAGYLEAAVLGRLSRNGHHLHRETVHQQQTQSSQTTQTQTPSQSPQHQSTSPTAAHTAATTTAAATAHHQVDINDLDLEELSARLYSRLRSRLRLELLVDRERAGQLSDYR